MQLKTPEKDELDGITDTAGIKLVRANCCPYIYCSVMQTSEAMRKDFPVGKTKPFNLKQAVQIRNQGSLLLSIITDKLK